MKIETNAKIYHFIENKDFKNFILFKINQYAKLKNFDYKQIDAKNKLKDLCTPKLKDWVREAYASFTK